MTDELTNRVDKHRDFDEQPEDSWNTVKEAVMIHADIHGDAKNMSASSPKAAEDSPSFCGPDIEDSSSSNVRVPDASTKGVLLMISQKLPEPPFEPGARNNTPTLPSNLAKTFVWHLPLVESHRLSHIVSSMSPVQ